jgi:hypothetical protein
VPANAEIDDRAPLPAKLRFAIAQRRLLGLEYNGRLRIVEPHDYGAMNGTSKLLVYQLHADGHDEARPAAGWRLLDLAKIGVCRVLEQTFAGSRGDAHELHMQWDAVFARVE